MIYYNQKSKQYPGRGIVKAIEAVLIFALVFVVTDAIVQRFMPTPISYGDAYYVIPSQQMVPLEYTYRPAEGNLSSFDFHSMALSYQMNGDVYLAADYYTRAINLNPAYAPSYLNRGVAYEHIGNTTLANQDFLAWVTRNSSMILEHADYTMGETLELTMQEGMMHRITFRAEEGQLLTASAISAPADRVDTLIVLLDRYGNPIASNDDIVFNGEVATMNSQISNFVVPHSCMYTLIVSHAGGGSYGSANGAISVTLDVQSR